LIDGCLLISMLEQRGLVRGLMRRLEAREEINPE
jgi:hypothetical protein